MALHHPRYKRASFLLNKTHIDQMTVRNEAVMDNMEEKNKDGRISRVFIEWQRCSPQSRRTTLRIPLVRNFIAKIYWWAAHHITWRLGCAFFSSSISHRYVKGEHRVPLSNEVLELSQLKGSANLWMNVTCKHLLAKRSVQLSHTCWHTKATWWVS